MSMTCHPKKQKAGEDQQQEKMCRQEKQRPLDAACGSHVNKSRKKFQSQFQGRRGQSTVGKNIGFNHATAIPARTQNK